MPKIAFILHESPARRMAGVEIYALHLARSFLSRGWEVACIFPDPGSDRPLGSTQTQTFQGVSFTSFAVPLRADVAARFKDDEIGTALARYLVDLAPDAVHFHHLIGFTGSALEAVKQAGLPSCMTVHDAWFCCNQCHLMRWDGVGCAEGPQSPELCATCLLERVPPLKTLYPLNTLTRIMALRGRYLVSALNQADRLLANSWYTRELLLSAGVDEDRVLLAPLGVPGFEPLPRSRRSGALRIGYLGNVTPKKRLGLLLRAFARLDPEQATLGVYGGFIHEGYRDAVAPLLDVAGVTAHGPYDHAEVAQILANLDVVVAPSLNESYGLVVREAFLAGVPVVASDIPAFREAVDHGVNGVLFPQGDEAELVRVLGRLCEDQTILDTLGSNIPPVRTIDDDCEKLVKLYTVPTA